MREHRNVRQRGGPAGRRENVWRRELRGGGKHATVVRDNAWATRAGRLSAIVAELQLTEAETHSPRRRPLHPILALLSACCGDVIDLMQRVVDRAKGKS